MKLGKFYEKGDVWMVLGIVTFFGFTELSNYTNTPWLFAVGTVALVLGGVQYTVRGKRDERSPKK